MNRIAAALSLLLLVADANRVFAADMPLPAPVSPPPVVGTIAPPYDWRGFYIGINGGYGFGTSSWSDPLNAFGTSGNFNTRGALVGGTLGGNFQMGAFVAGLEADMDWQGLKGSSSSGFCTSLATSAPGGVAGPAAGLSCQTRSDWLGTVRGRLGFAVDHFLFFGTGGLAFGGIQTGLTNFPLVGANGQLGWTAGAGVEVDLTDWLTAKVEYLYVNLGTAT
jgi:outer membrane immunogenic protein